MSANCPTIKSGAQVPEYISACVTGSVALKVDWLGNRLTYGQGLTARVVWTS